MKQQVPVNKVIFHLVNDKYVYIVFAVMIAMVGLLSYFLQQFERHPKWNFPKLFTSGMGAFLGFPCTYNPRNTAHRLGYFWFLFGCLIFATVLNATLIKLFESPLYYHQTATIEEIVNGDYNLIGGKVAQQKLLQQNQVFELLEISYLE